MLLAVIDRKGTRGFKGNEISEGESQKNYRSNRPYALSSRRVRFVFIGLIRVQSGNRFPSLPLPTLVSNSVAVR